MRTTRAVVKKSHDPYGSDPTHPVSHDGRDRVVSRTILNIGFWFNLRPCLRRVVGAAKRSVRIKILGLTVHFPLYRTFADTPNS